MTEKETEEIEGTSFDLPDEVRAGIISAANMAALYFRLLIVGGMTREEALVATTQWMSQISRK